MGIDKLVVVGASLAGLRAVETARKVGFDGQITLIGGEDHLPYDRPPLSKAFLEATGERPQVPFFRDEAFLREELDIQLMLGKPATGLDTETQVVQVDDTDVPYDALVIATGAEARHLPGSDELSGVHVLRTLDDSLAVRDALDAGASTVVIGAGFIGSEVASSAKKRGVDVVVIEALPTPLVRATGTLMGPAIASLHEQNGTELRCGAGVRALEGDGRVERVVLEDDSEISADLVIAGIGVSPSVSWLEGSGLHLEDGIQCDENLWTGVPGVYAAGDVANWPNPTLGVRQRMENWTAAAEQGAMAARNALDPSGGKAYGTVPYFWSDWYDVRIQHVGSPHADEVQLVEGDLDRPPGRDNRWIALYRKGDKLVGALTVEGQAEIMKYRVQIMKAGAWDDAVAHAAKRKQLHATKRAAAPAS